MLQRLDLMAVNWERYLIPSATELHSRIVEGRNGLELGVITYFLLRGR